MDEARGLCDALVRRCKPLPKSTNTHISGTLGVRKTLTVEVVLEQRPLFSVHMTMVSSFTLLSDTLDLSWIIELNFRSNGSSTFM